jgi:gamma-glutamylcyclotransferase (GGCT)/AIG2-like uncharacterized protein YtfP
MSKRLLFVYGTLKRGEFNDLSRYRPTPAYQGDGWVRGLLYDLGHCPAMVRNDDAGEVWGEVFELEESLFEALDQYEAQCGDYALEHVTVHMAERTLTACAYLFRPDVTNLGPAISAGRWSNRQASRETRVA